MGSLRVAVSVASALLALVVACGGQSDAPPHTNGGLDCLASPLTSFCCADSGPKACVGDFAAAQKCGTWVAGAKARVYATPCHGLVAVALEDTQYTTFYVYDATSGALYAIGDDAATNQPGSQSIECGAGPAGFTVPSDCGVTWLDSTKGQACAAGTSTPTSVCH